MSTEEVTSLRVSRRLRDELARLGSKDDSFEEILWRLVGAQKKD